MSVATHLEFSVPRFDESRRFPFVLGLSGAGGPSRSIAPGTVSRPRCEGGSVSFFASCAAGVGHDSKIFPAGFPPPAFGRCVFDPGFFADSFLPPELFASIAVAVGQSFEIRSSEGVFRFPPTPFARPSEAIGVGNIKSSFGVVVFESSAVVVESESCDEPSALSFVRSADVIRTDNHGRRDGVAEAFQVADNPVSASSSDSTDVFNEDVKRSAAADNSIHVSPKRRP